MRGISRPGVESVAIRIAEYFGPIDGDDDAYKVAFRWRFFIDAAEGYRSSLGLLLRKQLEGHLEWSTLGHVRQDLLLRHLEHHLSAQGLCALRWRAQQLDIAMRDNEDYGLLVEMCARGDSNPPPGPSAGTHRLPAPPPPPPASPSRRAASPAPSPRLSDDEIEHLSDEWLEVFILDALVEQVEGCGVAPGFDDPNLVGARGVEEQAAPLVEQVEGCGVAPGIDDPNLVGDRGVEEQAAPSDNAALLRAILALRTAHTGKDALTGGELHTALSAQGYAASLSKVKKLQGQSAGIPDDRTAGYS